MLRDRTWSLKVLGWAEIKTQYIEYKFNNASHEVDVEVMIDTQVIPMRKFQVS